MWQTTDRRMIAPARRGLSDEDRRCRGRWRKSREDVLDAAHLSKRRRRGAALIEFALVLPIFLIVMLGMMEFATLYFIRYAMLNAAREAVRSYAIRELDAAQTEQLALTQLAPINVDFSVVVSPQSDTGIERWVQVSAPITAATLGDPLDLFGGDDLSVRVAMRREE